MNNAELARLKALALVAKNDVIRSHGWAGSVEMGDHIMIDENFITAASPDVVLALIERIEALTVDAAPEHSKFGSPDLQAMIVKHATTPPVLAAPANSAVLPEFPPPGHYQHRYALRRARACGLHRRPTARIRPSLCSG